jgi:hypothetical protein
MLKKQVVDLGARVLLSKSAILWYTSYTMWVVK